MYKLIPRYFLMLVIMSLLSCDDDSDSQALFGNVKRINYLLFEGTVPGSEYDGAFIAYDQSKEVSVKKGNGNEIVYTYSEDSINAVERNKEGEFIAKFHYLREGDILIAAKWIHNDEGGPIAGASTQYFEYEGRRLKNIRTEYYDQSTTYTVIWDDAGENIIALISDELELRYKHDRKFNPFKKKILAATYLHVSAIAFYPRLAAFNNNNITHFTWRRKTDGLSIEHYVDYEYRNNRPVYMNIRGLLGGAGGEERMVTCSFEY